MTDNKKIVILGAGESGTGAAILAKAKEYDVFVSDFSAVKPKYRERLDERSIRWEEGGHTEKEILSATEIIKSPGIADTSPVMQKILRQGIPVISEIEFASRHTSATMIGITGSNGKTTTTTLTHHILRHGGVDASLAGNIGDSLARQVAEDPHDCYVIELSSFQLDNMYDFKAHIAVLLNITPDHLDRYGYDFKNYIASKFRITRNQTPDDLFIYWHDDPVIADRLKHHTISARPFSFALQRKEGVDAYIEDDILIIETKNGNFSMDRNLLSLAGEHNLYNSFAAAIAAKALFIRNERIREALSDFIGVPHRLEAVARVRGVDYINDSKATNVNSCWYALKSIPRKIVLIIGGTDKGNDYTEIEAVVREKVTALIFLGADNAKLHTFFDPTGIRAVDARSMPEAIEAAYALAEKGQTVLLSPCCASFDLFNNYEDRGNQFKECVLNL